MEAISWRVFYRIHLESNDLPMHNGSNKSKYHNSIMKYAYSDYKRWHL